MALASSFITLLMLSAMVCAMPAASTGLITEGLRCTVTALAAPASRVTGYPGAESAERWLTAELQRMWVGEI